jgi:Holliday junction DNA helicase RuvA
MINYLRGEILFVNENVLSLDVNGIGFEVFINNRTLTKINNEKNIALHIFTCFKKEKIELYGFIDLAEKNMFNLLVNKISGLGPKTAINVLNLGNEKITDAIKNAEASAFTHVPRLGKKMAQKIIIELKSKIGSIKELDLKDKTPKEQEAVSALTNLGFQEFEIEQALSKIEIEKENLANIIKVAMKLINRND